MQISLYLTKVNQDMRNERFLYKLTIKKQDSETRMISEPCFLSKNFRL